MRGGLRVIRTGLSRDDRVIVDGLPFAAPGSKVAPRDGAIRYEASEAGGQATQTAQAAQSK